VTIQLWRSSSGDPAVAIRQVADPQRAGFHGRRPFYLRRRGRSKPKTKQAVDGRFEGITRTVDLLGHQICNIIVYGYCLAHIMMPC